MLKRFESLHALCDSLERNFVRFFQNSLIDISYSVFFLFNVANIMCNIHGMTGASRMKMFSTSQLAAIYHCQNDIERYSSLPHKLYYIIYCAVYPLWSMNMAEPFNRRCRIYSGFHFLLATTF